MLLENNSYPSDDRVRREAMALIDGGHEVTVISPHPDRRFAIDDVDGVTTYRYPMPPDRGGLFGYVLEYGWAMVATAAFVVLALIRSGFDVIHAHNPPDFFAIFAVLLKPFGKRFVFDHHDLSPEMYEAKFGDDANQGLLRLLLSFEKLTFRQADLVVSTNESYREIALHRGGVAPQNTVVVRNAPDPNRVMRMPADPTIRSLGSYVIGFVGTVGTQDGVDHLIRAVGHIVEDQPATGIHCVIVGEGDALPLLRDLTTSLGLDSRVTFTGHLRGDALMPALSSFDVGVEPSPFNPYNDRSSMIKVSEFMLLGIPVVAYRLTENVRTAGDAAIYADGHEPQDLARAILKVKDDDGLSRRMSEVGLERMATELRWEHQASHLRDAYFALESLGDSPHDD